MPKLIKYALYGVGGFTLLMLLIAAYFALTFNPNDYKDDVIKLVKDKKQRTLNIEGDITLSYWPKIGADLGKISLSEHQSKTIFASVKNVKVALEVLPLFKKQFVVDTIYVDGANANVIRRKDGTFNFDDLMSKEKEDSQFKFDVEGVNVTNSEASFTNESTGARYSINKFNMKSGHIALAEPVDLETDFSVSANQPETAADVKLKGNFLIDPETKHFKVKGLDSTIVGDLFGGTGLKIKANGDIDAKPELMEFLVSDLKFVASGNFDNAKQSIDLSAPALTILKDQVSSQKVLLSIGQEKAGDVFKANMVLADMKGSPKALQSSGITGDLSAIQGKRTITGTFSSPFNGNITDLIFDIPKLAGNLTIKDPSLPNGGIKGSFNLAANTDIKKELASSKFNLNMADTKLTGDVSVIGFKTNVKPISIKFNLNADKLDLNKLLGKSIAISKTNNKTNNKPADMSTLKNMSLDGKLNIGSLIYDKYRVSGLNVGIKADGNKLALSGLNVKVDDSQIKGDVGISNFAKPLYTFDLDIDQVNVDNYVAATPAKATATQKDSPNKPLDLSALKSLNADGSIRIGKLKYGKTNASNVNIKLKSDGEKLNLNPLSAKVDDSQIKGNFGITQFSKPKFLFDLDIDALDANRYAASGNVNATSSEKSSGLSDLKSLLANGNFRIGSLKYDKFQISGLKASLTADGQKLNLNPLIAKVDDSQINANLGISQFDNPAYNFDIKIDRLDADRYITKGEAKTKSSADTQIDLSALKKLNATGEAKIGWLKLANVKTENVNLGLKAADGIAMLSPFAANLYSGSMAGTLKVDARATPSITFKQNMKNVLIGPLMIDAINNDMLSGQGSVNIDVTTQGNTVNALKKALLGNASLSLADGAIKGVDIAGSIRDLKSKVNIFKSKDSVSGDDKKKTDFSELTATFDIKNGVARNDDLAMKAPILRLAKGDSRGEIDIAQETINYIAKPSIVKSLKGQGGAELDDLSGIAIPVKITGTFADPKFGMDFAAIGSALAQSKLLDKVGGEKGAAVKELLGGDKIEGLKGLLGKKKPASPVLPDNIPPVNAPDGTQNGAETAPIPPAEKPKSLKDEAKEKVLEKLFNF